MFCLKTIFPLVFSFIVCSLSSAVSCKSSWVSLSFDVQGNIFSYLNFEDYLLIFRIQNSRYQQGFEQSFVSIFRENSSSKRKIKVLYFLLERPSLSHIQELDFSYLNINDDFFEKIQGQLPNVQSLCLRSISYDIKNFEEILKKLSSFSLLEKLDFSHNSFLYDQELNLLMNCSSLKFLDISFCNVSEKAFRILSFLPCLHTVLIKSNFYVGRDREFLGYVDRDRLPFCQLTDLSRLKFLVSLNLRDTWIDGNALVYLKDFKSLQFLNLSNNKIYNQNLIFLKFLSDLIELDLSETEITSDCFQYMKDLNCLKNLLIRKMNLILDIPHVFDLSSLSKLSFLGIAGSCPYKIHGGPTRMTQEAYDFFKEQWGDDFEIEEPIAFTLRE